MANEPWIIVNAQSPIAYVDIGIPFSGNYASDITISYGRATFLRATGNIAYYRITSNIRTRFNYSNNLSLGSPIRVYGMYISSGIGYEWVGATDGYFCQVLESGHDAEYPQIYGSDQIITTLKPLQTSITFGKGETPTPSIGYSFDMICGEGVNSLTLGCIHSDGTQSTEYLYSSGGNDSGHYHFGGRWSVSNGDITGIIVSSANTYSKGDVFAEWLVLKDETSYEINTYNFTLERDVKTSIEIIDNVGYDNHFKILEGIESYDVYMEDKIHDTTTKVATVTGYTSSSASVIRGVKRYQYLYITHIIPENLQFPINTYFVYPHGYADYDDSYAIQINPDDTYYIPLEYSDRYIQVSGIYTPPPSGEVTVYVTSEGIESAVIYNNGQIVGNITPVQSSVNVNVVEDSAVTISNIYVASGYDYSSFELSVRDYMGFELDVIPFNPVNGVTFYASYDTYAVYLYGSELTPATVTVTTVGVDSYDIYAAGDFIATVTEGSSNTFNVADQDLIEIRNIRLALHYNPDITVATFYKRDGSFYWMGHIDTAISFSADDDHGTIAIHAYKYTEIRGYVRKDASIASASVSVDGEDPIAVNSSYGAGFECYADSEITFTAVTVNANGGFKGPSEDGYYVLKWYPDAEAEAQERSECWHFADPNTLPNFKINPNRLYTEISAMLPEFLWYPTEEEDEERIQSGNLFTENFSAEMWNRFREKLKTVSGLFGLEYDYTDVSSGESFVGIGNVDKDFSQAVDMMEIIPNSTLHIGHKGTGAQVWASYFQGSGWSGDSLKTALNKLIRFYNGYTD